MQNSQQIIVTAHPLGNGVITNETCRKWGKRAGVSWCIALLDYENSNEKGVSWGNREKQQPGNTVTRSRDLPFMTAFLLAQFSMPQVGLL